MGSGRRRYYLIGIGGSGLSSLASYLLERGDEVHGSEHKRSPLLDRLRSRGAVIYEGHDPAQVSEDLDAVIHTAAVGDSHPEVSAAKEQGIPTCKYATFLGAELRERHGVAVAGTHGKTSTAGVLAHLLVAGGNDPSAVIGGFSRGWALPGRAGEGNEFVVEACEYDHSFLQMSPQSVVVTNIEADHLDYFGSERGVVQAFEDFLGKVQGNGWCVLHESAAAKLRRSRTRNRAIVVGEGAGVTDRLEWTPRTGRSLSARLWINRRHPVDLDPSIPGAHNVHNSALAVSIAYRLGVPIEKLQQGVHSFRGMQRRLEFLAQRDGLRWFADYAHHPTEVRAVREALHREWPASRILVVFQPHQACRTGHFRDRFADELARYEEVFFPGIFSVRESRDFIDEESRALLASLRLRGREAIETGGLDGVLDAVRTHAEPGDIVVLMGAGDIDDVAEEFRREIGEAAVV